MVAQEAIKMITKQYVPANGYCVVDLIDSNGVVQYTKRRLPGNEYKIEVYGAYRRIS